MFFQGLDAEKQGYIADLVKDKEFQDLFGHDPILDELDAEKLEPVKCLQLLLATIGKPIKLFDNSFKEKHVITSFLKKVLKKLHYLFFRVFDKFVKKNSYSFKQLTPLVWSYLWCLQSPIVTNCKDVTESDYDLFFYVLENGVNDDVLDLAQNAFGYCKAHEITLEQAKTIVNELVCRAFTPLSMFPVTRHEVQEQACFDADWLTSIVSKVHQQTGFNPEYIQETMSLTAVCYYYVQYCRQQGVKGIERMPPEEILKSQDYRACQIITDYLIKKGKLKEEEKDDFFKMISTPPNK